MATEIEQSERFILNKLLSEPRSFNFYQAIRLIGHLLAHEAKKGRKGSLAIIPLLSLAFPESDIHQLERDENNHFTLIATFFSLYGTTSPLPTFYTEQLIQDANQDENAVKLLLDIIHKRLYKLLFSAWSKGRIFEQFAEYKNPVYIKALYGFMGLAADEIREKIPKHEHLLRYATHWVSANKSVWSLRQFLTDYFKVPFNVHSFFRALQLIPQEQYCLLGNANNQVSKTAYLGSQFRSCNDSLLITIGPLTEDIFPQFLIGTTNINRLKLLLQLYIKEPFSYFIEVILDKGCFKPIKLAREVTSSLGVASWLSPQKDIEMFKVRYWLDADLDGL